MSARNLSTSWFISIKCHTQLETGELGRPQEKSVTSITVLLRVELLPPMGVNSGLYGTVLFMRPWKQTHR